MAIEGRDGCGGLGGRDRGQGHGCRDRDFDWIPNPGMRSGLEGIWELGGLENQGPSHPSLVEQWGLGCNVVVVLMAWEPVVRGNEWSSDDGWGYRWW